MMNEDDVKWLEEGLEQEVEGILFRLDDSSDLILLEAILADEE